MPDLTLWNKLTRREQRIVIKLFGGGSTRGDSLIETVNLTRLGFVTENGLTSAGLEVFVAAFKAQRDARQRELLGKSRGATRTASRLREAMFG
ncbi:hypothetical protein [Bradyrhizobium sp. LMG 9283]|uniref:hypothetical protein n=1 Tax=Bradyrhizobium sp. LMG 9283 TaxID=592064 RepID=UPI00388E73CA